MTSNLAVAPTPAVEAIVDFTAGIIGGTTSVYIGQPLDTVKVKLQTFPEKYPSAFQCFSHTLRHNGVSNGLYAGTLPSLLAQVSENAVLFMSYGICQKAVATVCNKHTQHLSVFQNAFAGSAAAFFSSLVLCPTELVKCKMQANADIITTAATSTGKPSGGWAITKEIIRTQGMSGMFRGLQATFAREMPGYFFFFGGYELSREAFTPEHGSKDDIGLLKTMACGAIGGVSLWLAVFPTDVIKSRVQVGGSNEPFFSMLINISRTEGVAALYKGLGPTLLRTVPATGGLFCAYEYSKKYMYYVTGHTEL